MNACSHPAHVARGLARGTALAAAFAVLALVATPLVGAGWNCGPKSKPRFSAIYVFGDSLSDTGRTASVINPPPPSVDSPWFRGRECNGPLWVEYLSSALGMRYEPLNNFAWAGATSGRENTDDPALPGLLDQLDEYLVSLGAVPQADPDALYVVFGGSNDFLKILRGEVDPAVALPEAIGNLVTIVVTLKAIGAEHILVVGVPDISVTPRVLAVDAVAPGTAALVKAMCQQFEAGLTATLDGMSLDVTYLSAFDLIDDFVANPCRYGFVNVTAPSCPDFRKAWRYMFWNDIHPTSLTHAWLANAVLDALDVKPVRRPWYPWVPIGWPHGFALRGDR